MVKILTGVVILMASTFVLPAPTGIQNSPKTTPANVDRSQPEVKQHLTSGERCPIHPPAGTPKNSKKVRKRMDESGFASLRFDGWKLIEPVPSNEGYQVDNQHLIGVTKPEDFKKLWKAGDGIPGRMKDALNTDNKLFSEIRERVLQRIKEWMKQPDNMEATNRLSFWIDIVLMQGSCTGLYHSFFRSIADCVPSLISG
ncbi:hypothetical protein C8R42DRAFT_318263 [Lentinula raphanica]|nr:hypothetical protein C8R42DRAFT_318263 [Lentinula raphanica]